MVGIELKDAFNKLTDDKGIHWHSVKELCIIIDKTHSSIRAKLNSLLNRNHVICKKTMQPITYNQRGNNKEVTVVKRVVLWRLI